MIARAMCGVQLTRHGGPDTLARLDDLPVTSPGPGEALLVFAGVAEGEEVLVTGASGGVALINEGRERPLVSRTYPQSGIAAAQEDCAASRWPGKFVLPPPEVSPC